MLSAPKVLTIDNIPQVLLESEWGEDKRINYRQQFPITFSTNFIGCAQLEEAGDLGVRTGELSFVAGLAPAVCMQAD